MKQNAKINISLESLLDFSAKLNENLEEQFILNSALLSLMGKLKIFRACVFVPDIKEKVFKVFICKGSKQHIDKIPLFPLDDLRTLNIKKEEDRKLYEMGYETCIPIKYQQDLLAIICLGKRADSKKLTQEEKHYAWLMSAITANAIQNSKFNNNLILTKNNLELQNQLLTTLFEMSREFSSFLSTEQILKSLSLRLMGQLTVTKFAVYLSSSNDTFELIINRFEKDFFIEDFNEFVNLSKATYISRLDDNLTIKSLLVSKSVEIISPMIVQNSIKGFLLVGKKMSKEEFSADNLLFIEALGNTAIAALENYRLFQEELEKKKLEGELALALEIQKKLLPSEIPQLPNFELAGMSIPSRHVGGDYYDFIELPDDNILITIADVSGKGMPASLLMANVQAVLRILAPLMLPLKELIHRINRIVYQNTSPEKFVTLFCGILNTRTRVFKYLNAGHNPPMYLKSNNEIEYLNEGGIILGFSEEPFTYTEGVVVLKSNELIVFYTDGITEAINSEKEEFGEDRLEKSIINCVKNSASDIQDYIYNDVMIHLNGLHPNDDITLIVLKTK